MKLDNKDALIINLACELHNACKVIENMACKDCKRRSCKSETTDPDGTKHIIDECPVSKDTTRWNKLTNPVHAYTQSGYIEYMTAQIKKIASEATINKLEKLNPKLKDKFNES